MKHQSVDTILRWWACKFYTRSIKNDWFFISLNGAEILMKIGLPCRFYLVNFLKLFRRGVFKKTSPVD